MYKQVKPLPTTAPLSFDGKEFQNPGHAYRMTYSWSWNVELTQEEIMRQIDDMADGGIHNVYVLPTPPEFRPEFAPTTMSPAYLSDAFMEVVRFTIAYGLKKDVHFWLYDEGGWPSGSANGLTCKDHPELVGRVLRREKRHLTAGQKYEPCEYAVAIFDESGKRLPENYIAEKDEEIWEYFTIVPRYFNNLYPDLLNPAATERFIGLTHERYKEYVSEEFGKSIPYMFTDEPAVHGPQWTIGANEDFKAKYGYDLIEHLPLFFDKSDVSEEQMKVRMDYRDWWSRLFADNYLGQLQSWCQANHLKSVGHMGGDDETAGSGIYGYGHIMRTLRKFDVPGVDAILGQILPQEPGTVYYQYANIQKPIGTNHFFPRFASSAAAQTGQRESLTESFGVYAASATCEEMRYVINFQLARGINKVNSMGLGYGRKGIFSHSDAVHCVPKDPSYYNRKEFLLSIARQCYLLSLGDPTVSIGMYLPVRDMWASEKLMKQAAESFDKAGVAMEAALCEFDVIDDDFLEDAELLDGCLHMGLAYYNTIVVPECRMMTEASKKKLEAFVQKGGKVLKAADGFIDALQPSAKLLKLEVEGNRAPVRALDPSIRVLKRKLTNGALYFIFNEGLAARSFTMAFGQQEPCYRADILDGSLRVLSGTDVCRMTGDMTEVDCKLRCGESITLLFTEDAVEAEAEDIFRIKEITPSMELTAFTAQRTMEMVMTSDEVFVKELKEPAAPIHLGDWTELYGKDFSGRVTYETILKKPLALQLRQDLLLDLGAVKHTCEVWLNGKKQAILCTTPYRCVLKAADLQEENILQIKVSNSCANQHVHNDCMKKWSVNEIGPYYQVSVALAERDVPSGLYGPVTVSII